MTQEEFRIKFSQAVAESDELLCTPDRGDCNCELSNDGLDTLTNIAEATAGPLFDRIAELERPVDLLLFCPNCGRQHIDEPNEATGWTNPPHRSHLCRTEDGGCGHIWRPADVATNGVADIKTQGRRDGDPAPCQVVNLDLLTVTKECERELSKAVALMPRRYCNQEDNRRCENLLDKVRAAIANARKHQQPNQQE